MVEPPRSAGPSCANCGAAWGDAIPAFCPHCGQESTVRPPTLGGFVQQFGGAYLSTEGALWRSLRLLLVQPGDQILLVDGRTGQKTPVEVDPPFGRWSAIDVLVAR